MHKNNLLSVYTYSHQRQMKNWGVLQDDKSLKIALKT